MPTMLAELVETDRNLWFEDIDAPRAAWDDEDEEDLEEEDLDDDWDDLDDEDEFDDLDWDDDEDDDDLEEYIDDEEDDEDW